MNRNLTYSFYLRSYLLVIVSVLCFLWIEQLIYAKENESFVRSEMLIRFLEGGRFSEYENEISSFSGDKKRFYTGLLCLYRGDYRQASDLLLGGLESESNQEDFYTSYARWMASFSSGFREKKSRSFILRYYPEDELMAEYALGSLEKICEGAYLLFGWRPLEDEKIIVEIYPNKKSFAIASTLGESILEKSGTVGICKFNRIMILSPRNLALGYRWVETLAHEYTHFVINRITQFNCPLWIHEGVSRWSDTVLVKISSENFSPPSLYLSDYSCRLLSEMIKGGKKFIPFDKMKNSLVYLPGKEDISLAFAEVADFVDYIVKSYGINNLKIWLEKMRFSDEKNSFKTTFGLSLSGAQKKWRQELAMRYSSSLSSRRSASSMPDLPLYEVKSEDELIEPDILRYARLGDELRKRGNYIPAYEEYKKAWVSSKRENPVLAVKMARALIGLGRFEEASELMTSVTQGNRSYITPYIVMMEIANQRNDNTSFLSFAREVFEINPFYPGVADIVTK